ncbi:hypothetical protein [Paraburkholderia fungorum]|uniref:Uncharacterized protein n=1 Tax=Paraburkholderia fungorum TaxID=134537 RepID=A0AAW3UV16_9BURK|nr:hypothetical protein [Paraburkholderia fungorum]MBB4513311.1 hypothetical protein [Paraburkholderia fungorum]MBB6201262.1 hypothetical protein [Paraburkholderia fungorum]
MRHPAACFILSAIDPDMLYLSLTNTVTTGVYFYDRHRTPIRLKPTIFHTSGNIHIDELDASGLPIAQLELPSDIFPPKSYEGTWVSYRNGQKLPIHLNLVAYSTYGAEPVPILQAASTDRWYFVIPSIATLNRVIEVRDKKTGDLVQALAPAHGTLCDWGIDTVKVKEDGPTPQVSVAGVAVKNGACVGATFTWDPQKQSFQEVRP